MTARAMDNANPPQNAFQYLAPSWPWRRAQSECRTAGISPKAPKKKVTQNVICGDGASRSVVTIVGVAGTGVARIVDAAGSTACTCAPPGRSSGARSTISREQLAPYGQVEVVGRGPVGAAPNRNPQREHEAAPGRTGWPHLLQFMGVFLGVETVRGPPDGHFVHSARRAPNRHVLTCDDTAPRPRVSPRCLRGSGACRRRSPPQR